MWSFANSIDFFYRVTSKNKCVAANYTSSPKKEDVYYLLNTFVALVREEANIGNSKNPHLKCYLKHEKGIGSM